MELTYENIEKARDYILSFYKKTTFGSIPLLFREINIEATPINTMNFIHGKEVYNEKKIGETTIGFPRFSNQNYSDVVEGVSFSMLGSLVEKFENKYIGAIVAMTDEFSLAVVTTPPEFSHDNMVFALANKNKEELIKNFNFIKILLEFVNDFNELAKKCFSIILFTAWQYSFLGYVPDMKGEIIENSIIPSIFTNEEKLIKWRKNYVF